MFPITKKNALSSSNRWRKDCCVTCLSGNQSRKSKGRAVSWGFVEMNPPKGSRWDPKHPIMYKNKFGRGSGVASYKVPHNLGARHQNNLREEVWLTVNNQIGTWKRLRKIWCQTTLLVHKGGGREKCKGNKNTLRDLAEPSKRSQEKDCKKWGAVNTPPPHKGWIIELGKGEVVD